MRLSFRQTKCASPRKYCKPSFYLLLALCAPLYFGSYYLVLL
jgi:hypothetical protein